MISVAGFARSVCDFGKGGIFEKQLLVNNMAHEISANVTKIDRCKVAALNLVHRQRSNNLAAIHHVKIANHSQGVRVIWCGK